jgi:hypothetical protein
MCKRGLWQAVVGRMGFYNEQQKKPISGDKPAEMRKIVFAMRNLKKG